jgi:hypothetical protein
MRAGVQPTASGEPCFWVGTVAERIGSDVFSIIEVGMLMVCWVGSLVDSPVAGKPEPPLQAETNITRRQISNRGFIQFSSIVALTDANRNK